MNDHENLEYFRKRGLMPFQAKIANSFIKNGDSPYLEVISPPGTGKTILSAAIIAHELKDGLNKRILVLAPKNLLLQNWQYTLQSLGAPFTDSTYAPIIVDRKKYLELESTAPSNRTEECFPALTLMNIDVAKRDDIATNLSKMIWDLVIIDESHNLVGKREILFNRLIKSGAIRRALLLTTIETQPPNDLVKKVRIEFKDIVNWNGQLVFGEFDRKVTRVGYYRSDEEQAFLGELENFAEKLDDGSQIGKWQKRLMLRVASSSIYATEKMLRRLRDSWESIRNKIAHGMPLVKEDLERVQIKLDAVSNDVRIIDKTSDTLSIQVMNFMSLYEELESLLRQIEVIETDTKLETLISYIQRQYNPQENSSICIWSSFVNTLQYISSSIQELGIPVYSLTSSSKPTEALDMLESFRNNGGILLLTEASYQFGLDLKNVFLGINYDLPLDSYRFQQRWGRFIHFGQKTRFKMVVLIDKSKTLSWEEEQLKELTIASL